MAKGQGKVATNRSAIVAAFPRACSDETAAVEFFETMRWGDSPHCAHCESGEVYQMRDRATGERNKRYLWRCRSCARQYTVRVNSVYEDSPIPMRHWAYAFWKACSSKKGVSALQIKRETGLSYKSSLFLMHRVRFAMQQDYAAEPKLGGQDKIVEADEMYVGGRPRYRQPKRGVAKGWLDRKVPIAALVERGGDIRSFVPADVTAFTLGRILRQNIDRESHLMTDSAPVYSHGLIGKFFAKHGVTDHKKGEYAKADGTHSNTVESAFSLLRRGLMGTFHNVSRKHLHRYVAEFDYRWNTRKLDDGARTATAIRQASGKRLRYKEPVAPRVLP
jgi:transposase-like protein